MFPKKRLTILRPLENDTYGIYDPLGVYYLFIYLFILCLLLTALQLYIYTHKKKDYSSQGKTTCDAN